MTERSWTKQLLAGLLSVTLVAAPVLAQSPQATAPADTKKEDKKKAKTAKQDVEQIGNRDVDGKLNFYSLEREVALGKQFAQEIERSARMVDDPVVVEYVNRVGQNIVRNSDAKVPFTIKVIDSDELNAFALPGGFFYVNSGLILAATEEAEMAGVMAHEIAHVTARHGTRNATKGEIAQLAMLPLLIFGPGGWAGYGIYQGLNFLVPLQFLKFSRDAEREADFLGLQYMYKTGYDPNAYIAFFEKVQAQEKKRPGSIPKMFSSHPPSAERIRNTQNEIATILPARGEYIVSTSEFDFVKERLRRLQSASKAQEDDPSKPTLRKRTEPDPKKGKDKQSKTEEDDDRPTLKRRP
jgi:predicted Zn-dependent protease